MTESNSGADRPYRKVPIQTDWTLFGDERVELGLQDHLLMVVVGIGMIGATAATTMPWFIGGVMGAFLAGWAGNNAAIAWRCERITPTEEDDD